MLNASQINLSWTASTDNVGVTGYRVERCQGAGCTNFAQVGAPAATSFNDTGLTPHTTYTLSGARRRRGRQPERLFDSRIGDHAGRARHDAADGADRPDARPRSAPARST